MGWLVVRSGAPNADFIKVSNGLGAVMLDVLAVAGCPRASTPWERRLVYWICCHDQERVGTRGLSINDMGWAKTELPEQKRFLLDVIDAALGREGWERLAFAPAEHLLFPVLTRLRAMIESVADESLEEPDPGAFVPNELPTHGTCGVHRVFRHETGCIVCNNSPVDTPPAAAPHRSP